MGTNATIVPLVAAAFPFVARLVETSLRELDAGVIEAAQSMGATPLQIIKIRKGMLRRMLMTKFSACISQPGRGRTPSLSPATSSTPRGCPSTRANAVERTVM